MRKPKILILTHDVIGENMAGPAVRCWEFARILSQETKVTLATPYQIPLSPAEQIFTLTTYDGANLRTLVEDNDVVIVSGYMLQTYPFLKDIQIPLIVDLYDPFNLESLPLFREVPSPQRENVYHQSNTAIVDLVTSGDFFLCASERQRDYWLGWLSALGRINYPTYNDDPTLRHLIDVVAFGVPDEPPQYNRPVLKGVHPNIKSSDKVIIWGGGIYNWFDPLTLIHAMSVVQSYRNDVKLVFLGIRHPNSTVVTGDMAKRTIDLSIELGLYETSVFFKDWTPYAERQNYLLEADIGISLHSAHVETRYSFRTRLLDYIWASLPMIVTAGDVLSELVEKEHLGWVVNYSDVQNTAQAILDGCNVQREQMRGQFQQAIRQFTWSNTTLPLRKFCLSAIRAPDKMELQDHLGTREINEYDESHNGVDVGHIFGPNVKRESHTSTGAVKVYHDLMRRIRNSLH